MLRPSRTQKDTARVARKDPRFAEAAFRLEHWEDFLEAAFALKQPPAPLQGFKLLLGQHDRALKAMVRSGAWQVIFLHRENELAAYASSRKALATGESHLRGDSEPSDFKPLFDAEKFARFAEQRRRARRKALRTLKAAGRPFLTLSYSELGQPDTSRRLLAFLGADSSAPLTSDLRKRGTSDILARFANPEAVTDPGSWATE